MAAIFAINSSKTVLEIAEFQVSFNNFSDMGAKEEKLPIVKIVTARDLRDAEDEIPVGNLFDDIPRFRLHQLYRRLFLNTISNQISIIKLIDLNNG